MTIVKGAGDRERRRDYVGTAAMCVSTLSERRERTHSWIDELILWK